MLVAVAGVLLGIAIGFLLPFQVPLAYAKYISVSFLAGLDSVIGAMRADIEDKYDILVFVTGFISNALLAALLTFMGDRLGVDLYLAALVTFGVRIFENLAWIRRDLIARHREAQAIASGELAAAGLSRPPSEAALPMLGDAEVALPRHSESAPSAAIRGPISPQAGGR